MAGGPGLPAEDISSQPAWLRTMNQQRPWSSVRPPALNAIPFESTKPESFYRRMTSFIPFVPGVFRDFIGSTLFQFIRWGFYGRDGMVDVKLERVHGHFESWLSLEGKSASLRSFTSRLFMYKNKKMFLGSTAKVRLRSDYESLEGGNRWVSP